MRKALVVVTMSVAMFSWGGTRVMAVCGDKVVDAGEDCDVGGTCIGGASAGTACTSEATCPNGKCKTFGGSGCAANCTFEHDVPYPMIPGSLLTCQEGPNAGKGCSTDNDCPRSTCAQGLTIAPGTSGVALVSNFLSIPLPFGGACNGGANASQSCATDADCPGATCVQSQQTLTVGKKSADGTIPVVVRAASVKFPGIGVTTLACGCIHGVAAKTCGGTLFEADGTTISTDCTPGFSKCKTATCDTAGEPCHEKNPCTFLHGEGNTASGVIGCDGLDGTDILYEQDSGGSSGVEGPALITLSGHGPAGSAVVAQTLGITAVLGACTGSDPEMYGPDGVFCTADDPPGGLVAVAGTLPAVSGTGTAVVHNANGTDGVDLGPVSVTGAPFSCTALESGANSSAAGGGLVGAFTFVHVQQVGDIAVTAQLFASGATPLCTGDCDGSGDITIDELIRLVNIGLGSTQSTCPSGVPSGSAVDITLIVQAVNHALNGCG